LRFPAPGAWLKRLWHRPAEDSVEILGDANWHLPKFSMCRCDGRDQVAGMAQAGWTEFEKPMPLYFAQAVRDAKGGLILDVGANTGFYSLLALCVSAKIRVVAYEPMNAIRDILYRNLMLNKARRRVSVLPFAVSNTNGEFTLFIPDDRHGLVETSASLSSAFKNEAGARQPVKTKTLDSMHLRGPRVAIIKIDAESHDIEVLRGAETLMRRDRPIVFVEVLFGADEQGLTDILNRCGYEDLVLFPEGASEPGDVVKHQTLAWNHMWVPKKDFFSEEKKQKTFASLSRFFPETLAHHKSFLVLFSKKNCFLTSVHVSPRYTRIR
jgi:FkbM family methyltransferase